MRAETRACRRRRYRRCAVTVEHGDERASSRPWPRTPYAAVGRARSRSRGAARRARRVVRPDGAGKRPPCGCSPEYGPERRRGKRCRHSIATNAEDDQDAHRLHFSASGSTGDLTVEENMPSIGSLRGERAERKQGGRLLGSAITRRFASGLRRDLSGRNEAEARARVLLMVVLATRRVLRARRAPTASIRCRGATSGASSTAW